MKRVSFAAFACGKRGSGKSFLLARYAGKFPRRIIVDPMGEYAELSGAMTCQSLSQTLDALEVAASQPEWIVVTCIDAKDVARLCGALAPVGSFEGGYSRAVGGVLVEHGEVDTIAPNNAGIRPEIRNIFQRGRHYLVSTAVGTQRPRDVHRVVTSQVDVMCLFRQHELRDLDYIARTTSEPVSKIVRSLEQYHHVRYFPGNGVCEVVDGTGRVRRTLDVFDGSERAEPSLFDKRDGDAESDNMDQ